MGRRCGADDAPGAAVDRRVLQSLRRPHAIAHAENLRDRGRAIVAGDVGRVSAITGCIERSRRIHNYQLCFASHLELVSVSYAVYPRLARRRDAPESRHATGGYSV